MTKSQQMAKSGRKGIGICVLVAWVSLFVNVAFAEIPLKEKKFIQHGWGYPTASFAKENFSRMEEMPFDGVLFDILLKPVDPQKKVVLRGELGWNCFSPYFFSYEDIKEEVETLKSIKFSRFKDNFQRLNFSPKDQQKKFDWLDEDYWKAILNNVAIATEAIKNAGFKGFIMDMEPYDKTDRPFCWNGKKTFSEYQKIVMKRGEEFIKQVNSIYPNITLIIIPYTYLPLLQGKLGGDNYGLLPAFVDGILKGCSEETLIFDGWEGAYYYRFEEQYKEAKERVLSAGEKSCDPAKFKKVFRVAFGVWIDAGRTFSTKNYESNHFTPMEYEYSLHYALKHSDGYVWVRSEKVNFWTRQNLTADYVEAIRKAKEPHPAGVKIEHHAKAGGVKVITLPKLRPLSVRIPQENELPVISSLLRGPYAVAFYSKANQKIKMLIECKQLGRYSEDLMWKIVDNEGREIKGGEIPYNSKEEIEFSMPEEGSYRILLNAGQNIYSARIINAWFGYPIPRNNFLHFCSRITPELYFYVPKGEKEFKIWVKTQGPAEGVSLKVVSPQQMQVASISGGWSKPQELKIEVSPPDAGKIWKIKIGKAEEIPCLEDVYIKFSSNIKGTLSELPDLVLIEE